MASELPRRLDDFCERSGQSFFTLQLQCAFCKFGLTLQELAEFHEKCLCLLYRNGIPYGACRGCLRLSAKLEYEMYCRCTVAAVQLSDILGQPLQTIAVRCVECYKLLDLAEKVDLCAGSEKCYLVRSLWRGRCRLCRKK